MRSAIEPSWRLLLLVVLLAPAVILRFAHLDGYATDYDDIGVLAIQKFERPYAPTSNVTLFGLEVSVRAGPALIHNLESSPFFPLYIANSWTYAPGQYALYPLLIRPSDPPASKHLKARLISAIFSVLALATFAWLLVDLERRLSAAVIIACLVPAYALQAIAYAHHSSPYSAAIFCIVIAAIAFNKYINKALHLYVFTAIQAFLIYFSYVNLVFVLALAASYLVIAGRQALQEPRQKATAAVLFAVLIAPLFVFLKTGRGAHGETFDTDAGVIELILTIPVHIATVAGSVLQPVAGFTPLFAVVAVLAMIGLLIGATRPKLSGERVYAVAFLFFLIAWIALWMTGKFPFTASRHVLPLLPGFAFGLFVLLRRLPQPTRLLTASTSAGILLALAGVGAIAVYQWQFLESRINAMDKALLRASIERHKPGAIITYDNTFEPALYFADELRVLNIEMIARRSGRADELTLPDRLLLISQFQSWGDYAPLLAEFPAFHRLLSDYDVVPILEVRGENNVSFNNSPISTVPNGAFIYFAERNGHASRR